MGLLTENDGEYQLSSDLPKAARTQASAEEVLPVTLAALFLDQDRVTNHDLGLAIAWYLCQDAYGAPHNWNTIDAALREQVGGDRFGITNSTPYGMFEDWVCYLGFAWTHALKDKTVLTPDMRAGGSLAASSAGSVAIGMAAVKPMVVAIAITRPFTSGRLEVVRNASRAYALP